MKLDTIEDTEEYDEEEIDIQQLRTPNKYNWGLI